MGLTITLENVKGAEREFIPLSDRVKSKVSLATQVARFYGDHFKVERAELWKYATLKELEGIPLGGLEIPDKYVTRENEAELSQKMQGLAVVDLFFSIIRFVGKWEGEGAEYEAYVSMSNAPNWSRVYGDVEVNVFPKGNVRDIVDIFYADKTTKRHLVDSFLDSFSGFNDGIFKVKGIYFALGVPSAEDFDLWRSAFVSSETRLLEDAITALKATGDEEIRKWLAPYSVPFLVRNLREIPRFETELHGFFDEHGIVEKETGSISYIGEDPESFKKFFADLSDKVLKPVIHSLPPDSDIASRIRKTIEKQSTLDAP
jgi:hypothetical protein